MNRLCTIGICASTVLALALLQGTAVAQQKTLKEQLVGAWTLVSSDATSPNGKKDQLYGANPVGVLILDASGRYAQVQGRPGRPKLKTANRAELDAPAADLKAVLLGFAANTGIWSVNQADKTLLRRYETALIPNNEGADQKASITISGDELKLTQTSPVSGVRTDAVYRRAK
jgi:Lipocalin-like domain